MSGLAWALGTFHTSVLGLLLLLLVYPRGGLGIALGGLSTITGLALFVALWATTVFATSRAIRGLQLLGAERAADRTFYRRALRWGAVNGALFLWSFTAILALQQFVTAPGTLQLGPVLLGTGFVLGVGTLFAVVIGAVVGLVLATLDLVGLRIARALAASVV